MDLQYSINENGAVFTVRLEPGMILELERQEVLGQVNGVVFCQAVIREGQRFLDYPYIRRSIAVYSLFVSMTG